VIIKDVVSFEISGESPFQEGFWEERLVRPEDIYEKFRRMGAQFVGEDEAFKQTFIKIITDTDFQGVFGPVDPEVARIIDLKLKQVVVGEDPFSVEKLWDMMYKTQIHGRKGEAMFAISSLDCALWDLIGKTKNEPVVKLLGGPVQNKVPVYASMLGFSIKPEKVVERCLEMVEKGFSSLKWFFRHGPGSGAYGVKENIELVKTIRDCVGDDVDVMLDCWNSWTVPYALKIAKKIERYEPAWLEEPVMPDNIDGYAELRKKVDIPIAGGEHEYTRWGVKELLKREAVDILQVDVKWSGGITELKKICALTSAENIPLIPHAGWTEPAQAVIFSQPQTVCPQIEYLVKHSQVQQAFNQHKLKPKNGFFSAPDKIGLGFEPQKT
jgi:L-alanine-DL-glutamate epimerase-like enolase superfamily enzyme